MTVALNKNTGLKHNTINSPKDPSFIVARSNPAIVNQHLKQAPKYIFARFNLAIKRYPKRTNNYQLTTLNLFGGIPPPKLWQGSG